MAPHRKLQTAALTLSATLLLGGTAVATPQADVTADVTAGVAPPVTAKPKPVPYSLPWQLRPVTAGNVVRSDTAVAMTTGADGSSGTTVASMLLVSYKVLPNFAPLVRVGYVNNNPSGDAAAGQSLVNPVVGGTYTFVLSPELKLGAFLGVAVPVGMGGGNTPDAPTAAAARSGILARSAMDNAMFAVNDLTVFPGVDLSYQKAGFTVQAEATVLQLTRVRGEDVQADASKTNFTSGLHVGYFFHPMFSLGGEVRHQRWIVPPAAAKGTPAMHNTTAAVGPRFHFKLGDGYWLRPGIAYATGFDKPMTASRYQIVQVDLPLAF